MRYKILLLSVCLLFALSWVGVASSPIFKFTTEKKEALPQSEVEVEERTLELVYDFSPALTAQVQHIIHNDNLFLKIINFPESIALDTSKRPPKLNC